jgi:CDP-diacylglycerol--glycerol-3-phosphate 3-phosphatidyltransferase
MKCRSTSIQSNQTPDIQIARRDFFYVSNILSLFRLLLTPLIFYSIKQRHSVGILTFGSLAILSDALDGFLARRLNQSSELGKILDPIADKIVIAAVLFALVSNSTFPRLAFGIIIIRDTLILLGNGIVLYRVRTITRSNWWGKCSTFFLSVAMILYVLDQQKILDLQNETLFYVLCVGLLFMAISSWTYSQRMLRLLQTRVPPRQQTA